MRSLFIWHFVEEVEHRSSALIIFDSIVGSDVYRMRMAPSIFRHVMKVIRIACKGFNAHVPLEDRQVDSMSMFAMHRHRRRLGRWIAPLGVPANGTMPRAFTELPLRAQLVALSGVVRSRMPRHNPAHEDLPELANLWFRRFDEGYDVSQWYTAELTSSK